MRIEQTIVVLAPISCIGSSCRAPGPTGVLPIAYRQVSAEQLVETVSQLEPWRSTRFLSAEQWDSYVSVARLVQKCDPRVVCEAFVQLYQDDPRGKLDESRGERGMRDFMRGSKAYILLRVMFELPEAFPDGEPRYFVGVHRGPGMVPGKGPVGWPVGWQEGRPFLMSGWTGCPGVPYAVCEEYDYFRESFPMKQLD